MSIVDNFVEKKKAESAFIGLEDGETIVVRELKDIKMVTKAGFGGEEKDVLRLVCIVETSEGAREKVFDNGTQRFAKELQEKGVRIGSGFKLTRTGLMTKTKYTVSEVSNTVVPTPTAQAAAAPVAAAAPKTLEEEAAANVAPAQSSLSGMIAPKE